MKEECRSVHLTAVFVCHCLTLKIAQKVTLDRGFMQLFLAQDILNQQYIDWKYKYIHT